MRNFLLGLFLVILLAPSVCADEEAEKKGKTKFSAEAFSGLSLRNIGPAQRSGRISDIVKDPMKSSTWYVAVASGNVWKTVNNGTTWKPIFDDYPSASIGDIAVFQPNPDIVWVGTGEANNRNSVAWGDGVFASQDGGETFAHKGLEATHQIARVVIHHSSPEVVFVCAIGIYGDTPASGDCSRPSMAVTVASTFTCLWPGMTWPR